MHDKSLCRPSRCHHCSCCIPISSPQNNLAAQHLNNVKQANLTWLQILTQTPLFKTHQQPINPTNCKTTQTPHPDTPPLVSDYNSDSSDKENHPVTTQPRVLQPSPRMTPTPTTVPCQRQTKTHSPPAYNLCSCIQSITQETILHLLHHTATPRTPVQCFPRKVLSAILDTYTGKL